MKEKILKKENMLIFALVGILLLVIAIPIDSGNSKEEKADDSKIKDNNDKMDEDYTDVTKDEALEYSLAMEERIEEFLSCMDGVGEVQVMVTLAASKELIVEKDEPVIRSTVTETDGSGGTRSTNESNYDYETIYQTDSNGNKIPYVIKQVEP